MNINYMYTDIDSELKMSWNKDINASRGARAVKQCMLGIITTRRGTRPFDPEFGCDLTNQLFENINPLTIDTVQREIYSSLRRYEPRIKNLNINIIPLIDDNEIIVEILFSILDNPDQLEELKLRLQQ